MEQDIGFWIENLPTGHPYFWGNLHVMSYLEWLNLQDQSKILDRYRKYLRFSHL